LLREELEIVFHSFGERNQTVHSINIPNEGNHALFLFIFGFTFSGISSRDVAPLPDSGHSKRTAIHHQFTMKQSHFVGILLRFAITPLTWPNFPLCGSPQASAGLILQLNFCVPNFYRESEDKYPWRPFCAMTILRKQ
jgi:hypothetical protein